jgi:hypothetical protein
MDPQRHPSFSEYSTAGVSSSTSPWDLWLIFESGVHAVAGETAKAKGAYQDFFKIWKDADPDIPILNEARRSTRSCK